MYIYIFLNGNFLMILVVLYTGKNITFSYSSREMPLEDQTLTALEKASHLILRMSSFPGGMIIEARSEYSRKLKT